MDRDETSIDNEPKLAEENAAILGLGDPAHEEEGSPVDGVIENVEQALKKAAYGEDLGTDRIVKEKLKPLESFAEANLHPQLLETIANIGWSKPTDVQGLCLPYALKGREVAGFAQTGTGKTGVFLITIAQLKLQETEKKQGSSPFAVVLAPTRELAIQIEEEASKLFSQLGIRTLAIYGGMEYEAQAHKIKAGVDVVVATPGRLKDYSEKKFFSFKDTKVFVCDEVDRMFDMGFVEDVEYFLNKLQPDCQKLLFSATTNDKVKELAFEYLANPEYLSVSPEELTPERIEQHALLCEIPDKFRILLSLLKEHQPERAIIFTNTKLTAAWLHYKLTGNNLKADIITGDLPQVKRVRLIKRIKAGDVQVLIATDVASRGLHISGVSHVYNFDIPDEPANYVHRIGRTARAGAKGSAYSLVCDEYATNFLAVQEMLGKDAPKSVWPPESYAQIEDKAGNPFADDFGKAHLRKDDDEPRHERHPRERDRAPSGGRGRYGQEARDGSRDGRQRHGQQQGRRDHGHDQRHGRGQQQRPRITPKAPAVQQTRSVGSMFKRVFKLFFGWLMPRK